jgi:hypothetical protein
MRMIMPVYHDDNTRASDSVKIRLSEARLQKLQPELAAACNAPVGFRGASGQLTVRQVVELIAEHMSFGDSGAAVVVQEAPLVVAAYTDERDCVALLGFPGRLRQDYQLHSGSRLLTINTYGRGKVVSPDLIPGPAALGRWTAFYPIIAEFVSDDMELIAKRKESISSDEWQRTWSLGVARLRDPAPRVRDGRPLLSMNPA